MRKLLPFAAPAAIACLLLAAACSKTQKNVTCGADLQRDPVNCGACGNICASGQSCVAAVCVAPADPCAGKNLETDAQNCGTCGHACPASNTCAAGVCQPPAAVLGVAIVSPADGAHVLPKLTVKVTVTATGTVDSLTLQAGSAAPVTLTPGAFATANLDLTATPDGQTVTLTAQVKQGTNTVTSAPVHVVVDRTPLVATGFAGGFYKVNETVTLKAVLPAGSPVTKVDFAAAGSSTPLATATQPSTSSAGLTFTASVPALQVGRGDVDLTATASDAAGNSGLATATLTIGLLHGTTSNPQPLTTALALDSPGGQGILWAANAKGSNPTLGELRYAATGGGREVKLASQACIDSSVQNSALTTLAGLVSADASAIAFTAPGVQTARGLGVIAQRCNYLLFSPLPATGPARQLSTSYLASTVALSLDGSVIAWLENGTGANVLVGGALAGTPAALNVGTIASRVTTFPLVGALLINVLDSSGNPTASSFRLTAQGIEPLRLGSAGIALPLKTTGGLYNGSEQDNGGAAGPNQHQTTQTSADGTVLLANTPQGLVSIPAARGGAVTLVCAASVCTDLWQLRGTLFSYQRTSNPADTTNASWNFDFVSATTSYPEIAGATEYQAPGPLSYFNPILPRDNSAQAYVTGANPYAAGLVLTADPAHPVALASGLDPQIQLQFLNWLSSASQLANYSAGNLLFPQSYTSFDDPAHALLFDSQSLYGVTVGATTTAVRLDNQGSPFSKGPSQLYLTADHKHAYWQGSDGVLSAWAVGAPAARKLGPMGDGILPVTLPKGPTTYPAQAASDELSSQSVAYVTQLGGLAVQSWDGGTVRTLVPSDSGNSVDTAELRFGVTPGEVAFWYSIDKHLRAQSLAPGSAVVDFGAILNPEQMIALAGGGFLFVAGPSNLLSFASVAQPAPVVLGSTTGGYGRAESTSGISVDDDKKGAYVREPGGQVFYVTAGQPPLKIAAVTNLGAAPYLDTLTGWSGAVDAGSGSLWLGSVRSGAQAPVQVETANVLSVADAGGHSIPASTGYLVMQPEFTQAAGPRFRWAVTYSVGGTQRPGIYLWDVVDGQGL